MRKITAKIECPGDKLGTSIVFRAPPAIGVEVVQFKCAACGSDLLSRVKRGSDWSKGQIAFHTRIVKPSDLLIQMMNEEREHTEESA